MGRFTAGNRSTGAGSATLPIASLYAIANIGGFLREVGVFNTTSTALQITLRRLTTAGTQGAGLSENEYNPDGPTPQLTGFNTHTGAPTLTGGFLRYASLGAAVGSGIIWTFGGQGLWIPPGTANGIGLVPVGTGQICDFYFDWEE